MIVRTALGLTAVERLALTASTAVLSILAVDLEIVVQE